MKVSIDENKKYTYHDIKEHIGKGKLEIKERSFISLRDLFLGMEVLGFNRKIYLKFRKYEDGLKVSFQTRERQPTTDNLLTFLEEILDERIVQETMEYRSEMVMEGVDLVTLKDFKVESFVREHFLKWKQEVLEETFNLPLFMNDGNSVLRKSPIELLNWETLHRFGGQGNMHPLTVEVSVPLTEERISFPMYLRHWEYLYHTPETITDLARKMLLNSTTVQVNVVPD